MVNVVVPKQDGTARIRIDVVWGLTNAICMGTSQLNIRIRHYIGQHSQDIIEGDRRSLLFCIYYSAERGICAFDRKSISNQSVKEN